VADAPDRFYPKQRLDKAVERGMARPKDTEMRQKVRMGDDPERMQREDFSIRTAHATGREVTRGLTVGDLEKRMEDDRAGSRRPRGRPSSRRSPRGR
jgi:hypothetical protein